MTTVGPTVPFHTEMQGVLSAVYDPVNQALRMSGGGGGSNNLSGLNDVLFTTLVDGDVLTYVSSAGKWENIQPTGGPPSGAAGGQLSGTYPNPSLGITTTRGDLIVRNATQNTRLGIGSTAAFLQSDGTDPSWQIPSSSDITVGFGSIDLQTTGVTPATYGDSSHIPVFDVDDKGRISAVTNIPVSAAGSGPFLDTTVFTATPTSHTGFADGTYASADSAVAYTASGSNYTVDVHYGSIYFEPIVSGSGALPPFTRTVQVGYTVGQTFIVKADASAFIAGDVGATVASGSGIPAATTITSLGASNTHANINTTVTISHASIAKVFSRGTAATGYTGSSFIPTLTEQVAIYVPPLSVASGNTAAYLSGLTVDGNGNLAVIATTTLGDTGQTVIDTDGVIVSSSKGHIFGDSTNELAGTPGVEINGQTTSIPIHVYNAFLGLHFVASEFNGGKSSIDLRSTDGASLSALSHTTSGTIMGAIHIGGSYDAGNGLVDCAQIYCVATENFGTGSGGSIASGCRWDFYTTLNTTATKGLALRLGNDKTITTYGAIVPNSGTQNITGILAVSSSVSMVGALTGVTNVQLTDGTLSYITNTGTFGTNGIAWDATTSTQTGAPIWLLAGEKYTAGLAAVVAGDTLGSVVFAGQYDTTVGHHANGVQLRGIAEGTFASTTNRPSHLEILTGTTSGALVIRSVIDSVGTFYHGGITVTSGLVAASNFSVDTSGNVIVIGTLTQGTSSANVWGATGNLSRGATGTWDLKTTATNINLRLEADPGAAVASAAAIGAFSMRASEDNAHTIANGVQLIGTATATWSSTVHGARLGIFTRPNTASAAIAQVAVFDQDGTFGVGSNVVGSSNTAFITGAGAFTAASATLSAAQAGAVASVTQGTVGNPVASFISTATNDDPIVTVLHYRGTSTGAGGDTIGTYSLPASKTTFMDALISCRRTGGASGTADDGGAFVVRAAFQGGAQIGATTTTVIGRNIGTITATMSYSSNTVLVTVTGAATTNYTWHATIWVTTVGT